MSDSVSRRDWLKTMGLVGAGALVAPDALQLAAPVAGQVATTPPVGPAAPVVRHAPGTVLDLVSTSEIFIPPRGRSFQKFSFDFPEPSVAFGDYTLRISRIHRREHLRSRPCGDNDRRQWRRADAHV